MADRRLSAEINRSLKKVNESFETLEEIWLKVHDVANANRKEKYEADLKQEIKKLMRQREQIKTWLASSEVKDKKDLSNYRQLIENQIKRFKVVKREIKTKAYSKEGLSAAHKLDPAQEEKDEITNWLSNSIENCPNKWNYLKKDREKQERYDYVKNRVEKHRYHIKQLETLMRMLDNELAEVEQIKKIKDDIEYYIESSQDKEFQDNEYIYNDFDLEDMQVFRANNVVVTKTPYAAAVVSSVTGSRTSLSSLSSTTTKISSISSITTVTNDSSSIDNNNYPTSTVVTLHSAAAAAASTIKSAPTAIVINTNPNQTNPWNASNRAAIISNNANSTQQQQQQPPIQLTPQQQQYLLQNNHLLNGYKGITNVENLNGLQSFQHLDHLDHANSLENNLMMHQRQMQTANVPVSFVWPPTNMATTVNQQNNPQQQQQPPIQLTPQQQQYLLQNNQQNNPQQQQPQQPQPPPSQQLPNQMNISQQQVDVTEDENILSELNNLVNQILQETQPNQPPQSPDLYSSTMLSSQPNKPTITKQTSFNMHLLDEGFRQPIIPIDSYRLRPLHIKQPQIHTYSQMSSFPNQTLPQLHDIDFYDRFTLETLFFIFYYMEGSKAQYMAAKTLKNKSWRFHTKHMTWFQRLDKPKLITDDYEQGTVVYFDIIKWIPTKNRQLYI
ncbi:CCR4-NOT transcription complex, subunit 3 [Dermatophagoides farinae]|uniref:CCR4-NOT transcription complex, subunit 3 n=1 Tax=Dermatophagoides farinae TaxID=6954 RepID=A0A922HU01_DERFA|nr:CCR4-NOT transcription complex, subunit 3 [Dermatophagoides farinae]